MAIVLITAPDEEPMSLAEAKEHLRATGTDEDALITRLIRAARRRVENYTWRRLVTQTLDYTLDEFCGDDKGVIELPCAPLQSISFVKYVDTAGVEQTLSASDYLVDAKSEPARIAPAYALTWPSIRDQLNAVTIRMVCGYGLAAKVPDDIVAALKLIIGHLYEHREEVGDFETFPVPNSVQDLLFPYRVLRF